MTAIDLRAAMPSLMGLLCLATTAIAQSAFRCEDDGGNIRYQQTACDAASETQALDLRPGPGAPAPEEESTLARQLRFDELLRQGKLARGMSRSDVQRLLGAPSQRNIHRRSAREYWHYWARPDGNYRPRRHYREQRLVVIFDADTGELLEAPSPQSGDAATGQTIQHPSLCVDCRTPVARRGGLIASGTAPGKNPPRVGTRQRAFITTSVADSAAQRFETLLSQGLLARGMSREQARSLLGEPTDILPVVRSGRELWIYMAAGQVDYRPRDRYPQLSIDLSFDGETGTLLEVNALEHDPAAGALSGEDFRLCVDCRPASGPGRVSQGRATPARESCCP